MKELLAIIAALLAFAGGIPYLRKVLKHQVKPHPYTWLVGSIVSLITLSGMVVKGAGIGALPTAISEGFTIIIFFLSLKYGFKQIPKTDIIFLIIALGAIIPWFLTNDPTISIIIAVGIDLVSFIPTIKKTMLHPDTETSSIYSMNALRHILTLFSLEAYNIATTLHSVAMIILNAGMTILILRRPAKKITLEE